MSGMPSATKAQALAPFFERIVQWQRVHGRCDLPWQQQPTAYTIWLSEVMLQQTQVNAVIGYYQRFLIRFPTVFDLAAASLDAVLSVWSGLGYYARARNLHRTAQLVVARYSGEFPPFAEALAELPGIGRSTASAIAAFAFGCRAAILDGNVKRVLVRHIALEADPSALQTQTLLWREAEARLPAEVYPEQIKTYTQGMMDLGSLVCLRRQPRCSLCPVSADCLAFNSGQQQSLPRPKLKKALETRRVVMVVLTDGTGVLLERRPAEGVWGGLWSLPEYSDEAEALAWVVHHRGAVIHQLPEFTHTFTHFRLKISPVVACSAGRFPQLQWHDWDAAFELGLPKPVRRLLEEVSAMVLKSDIKS